MLRGFVLGKCIEMPKIGTLQTVLKIFTENDTFILVHFYQALRFFFSTFSTINQATVETF